MGPQRTDYKAPELMRLGSLTELTLGTGGTRDDNGTPTKNVPGPPPPKPK